MKKVTRILIWISASLYATGGIAATDAPTQRRAVRGREPASAGPARQGSPITQAERDRIERSRTLYGREKVITAQEQMDRAVDVAAVASRETAITNLKRMLRLKKGTREEPGLIWRLSDIQWKASKSYFRVGMTASEREEANRRYEALLNQVVLNTSDVLTRFPSFKDRREVLLRRGRAYEELKRKDLALKDYLDYIDRYPNEDQTVSVRLMASDVLAEFKQHSEILRVLKPVDLSRTYGGLVRDVVERQALANYNVDNFPEALRRTEWLLVYDRRRKAHLEKGGSYDEAVGMVALIYGTAFEKQLGGYTLEGALDYFRRIEGGIALGRLSHEFVLVLRAKEMQAEVVEWKDLFIRKLPNHYETVIAMVDVYDAILNWKLYPKFGEIDRDFGEFFARNPQYTARAQKEDSFSRFKKSLLEFADKLYATLPKKNPGEADFKIIGEPYLKALNAFMRITDPQDTMKARVRFRIGEFYVGMKDWDRAQQAFSEVYQARLFVVESMELRNQARLKAMTARYDSFKEKGIIPKDLKAVALSAPKKTLSPEVAEWIRWVDEVARDKSMAASDKGAPTNAQSLAQFNETMDTMLFEANRLIYVQGDVELAYKRMLVYIGSRPNSKMTPATCALVIDTLINSEAWVATRTLAIKFQSMPNVSIGDFKKKLEELEQDSHYKITQNFYKTKDYPKALAFAEEHLRLYPESKRKVDLYSMLGKAAAETKKDDLALQYMSEVIRLDPNHATAGVALSLRAQSHEKNFRYREAFDDYYKVYRMPADRRGISESELPILRRKLFALGISLDEPSVMKTIAEAPEFCGARNGGDLRVDCDRLMAMRTLGGEIGGRKSAWELIETGHKSPRESRAAWYAAALVRGHQIPNSVVKQTVEDLEKTIGQLDTLTQMQVLSSLNDSVPRLFDRKVATVEELSPISRKLDQLEKSLKKRVGEMNGLETLAGSLVKLPSPEIRVRILGRLAQAYQKAADEVRQIPVPKGFSAEETETFKQGIASVSDPLQQKVSMMGSQVWEVARQHGLQTIWMDPAQEQAVGDLYQQGVFWDEVDAYLGGLTDQEKTSPWVKAIREGRSRSMVFYYGFANAPGSERLALSESGRILLQYATLAKLKLDSALLDLQKEKESSLSGNPLRLSMMGRLYKHVRSRSLEDMKSARGSLERKRFEGESHEEKRIIRIAFEHEKRIEALKERQAEEAKARAVAEAATRKAEKRNPAGDEEAAKEGKKQ